MNSKHAAGMAESRKRVLGSPTGTTPIRPTKRTPGRPHKLKSKKKLEFCKKSTSAKVTIQDWSKEEDRALVQFVLLMGTGSAWPASKSIQYWEKAAKFIHQQCESKPLRTSKLLKYSEIIQWAIPDNEYTSLLRKSFVKPPPLQ